MALIVLTGVLLLALQRPPARDVELAITGTYGQTAQFSANSLTPAEKVAMDAEKLAHFKARVAGLNNRPVVNVLAEIDDSPEVRGLITLKTELESIETEVAALEEKVNRVALSLGVPPGWTSSEVHSIDSDRDDSRKYQPYLVAVRERTTRERMRDLLRMQILQEELGRQNSHGQNQ